MSRWDRETIEIRVIDIQENPTADLAILEWIVNFTKALVDEKWTSLDDQKKWSENSLYDILMAVIQDGEQAIISNSQYLSQFGLSREKASAQELCIHIFESLQEEYSFSESAVDHLELIFNDGPLARRILDSLPENFGNDDLFDVYETLSDCLRHGTPFIP